MSGNAVDRTPPARDDLGMPASDGCPEGLLHVAADALGPVGAALTAGPAGPPLTADPAGPTLTAGPVGPALTADPDAFLEAFESLTQAIRRARGTSALDADGRLTFSQYALVRALAGREAARIRDLAGDAAISPSTATRILDALERRALVRRDRVPEDRRGVTITLTDSGRAALDRQDTWMRGRQLAFYDELGPEQQTLAHDLLVRLATLIDELAAGPDA